MKVFLSVASLAAHYGGPARSVLGLAKALSQSDVQVGLWAADRSYPIAFDSADWVPKLQLFQNSLEQSLSQFGAPDILHDNGIWLAHNRQIARFSQRHKIPRIVSLRGMIEPWAMQHSGWKKRLAWPTYQRKHLQSATCFHGTADKEAIHAKELGLSPRCFIVSNGIDLLEELPISASILPQPQTALFLGRLHPVKGLELFIEAWANCSPKNWKVMLAGPDENGYQSRLKALLEKKNLTHQFEFLGSVDNQRKAELFQQVDMLIQPSYTENFGLAIAESLASGVPVLTTTGTPWEKIAETGCGWWVPATTEGLEEAIRQATACTKAELREMGDIGRSQVADDYSWTKIADQFLDIYQWMTNPTAVSTKPV